MSFETGSSPGNDFVSSTARLGTLRAKPLRSFEMEWSRSVQMRVSDSHLDFLTENLGAVSGKHGEGFRSDISMVNPRYQGKRKSRTLLLDGSSSQIPKKKKKNQLPFFKAT